MNYTDTQLKAVLAKMLPEILAFEFDLLFWKHKQNQEILRDPTVLDTELLHLCWMVEESLNEADCREYAALLALKRGLDYARTHRVQDYSTLFSTWQQRVIALAKVKGIKV